MDKKGLISEDSRAGPKTDKKGLNCSNQERANETNFIQFVYLQWSIIDKIYPISRVTPPMLKK